MKKCSYSASGGDLFAVRRPARRVATALALATFLGLSGCASLAPQYGRPASPVPNSWPQGQSYQEGAGRESESAIAPIPWQDFFVEPRLQELLLLALENNRDLRLAALAIDRARAQYRIQSADQAPTVGATGGGSGQRVPADLSSSGHAVTAQQFAVGVGISSYELDFFGRVASLQAQALDQYLATQEARQTVRIALIGEVAAAYLNLAADRERLKLAEETLVAQEESYKLIKRRFELGVSSELDLRQAQTRVDTARVDIARYTTAEAQDANALTLVVGAPVPVELLPTALSETLTAVKTISPDLPSTVLLRRPDVRQAELLLQAAHANIGAARAAFFPRIALSSSVGLGSSDLFGLIQGGALVWSVAPQLTAPIFDHGRKEAGLEVAEVEKRMALSRYEKAIQTAFLEVADALARQGTIDEQVAAQQSLTEATAVSSRLAQLRFERGLESFLPVLDAQRSLYAAQQGVIATRLTRLLNLVTLYKVLGNGGDGGELSKK